MKRIGFLVLILIGMFNTISFACSCGGDGPFLQAMPRTDLTVLVKVKSYGDFVEIPQTNHSMTVQILEVLKGEESRNKIKIYGDDGFSCRPYVSHFPIASTWVISLYRYEKGDNKDAYVVSSCGEYYLPFDHKNNTVKGGIMITSDCDKDTAISVLQLKEMMRQPDSYILPTKACYYDTTSYSWVGKMPEYKYGVDSLNNLIIKKLKINPEDYIKYHNSLYLAFNVEMDGSVTDVKISTSRYQTKTLEKYLDNLIELIKSTSGQWIPGKHFGKDYRVHYYYYQFEFREICKKKNEELKKGDR